MSYRVPDEDTVSDAITAVIRKTPRIETQAEFVRMIRDELLKKDSGYRIGGGRTRRIGLERGIVGISIEYRDSNTDSIPHICPVCGNAMASVMNMSLDGDSVEIKRKCTVCPYAIGKDVLVPSRYIFSKASAGDVSFREVSVRKLRKASAKIREAADLIRSAVEGTELEERGSKLISGLREITDSDESSVSIKNISRDIRHIGEEPIWMKPAVSIKNSDRKDI
ncbi:MAG: hypothetical protein LBJ20_01760 [Candidatus Methanoplasma sp.]|jgi:hypothetical protein|nr:hypothetical protein [Candidatus Methanoplasma sp.]